MNKTTTCRLNTEFVERAKAKNLTPAEFADQLLQQSQAINLREQELALARLDVMESKIYAVLKSHQDIEQKIDTLTDLLNNLFSKLGE
ncbi:hypothetical protein [Achromobacter mucicolens]|jgi:hypothetical protein|uniref:hypothetical protein n=1 Tax=Burkholderiales TaxID=80840 RepID=UPI0024484F41|nr:hypothetical protein [Achromobacter mucicolens]MDG9967510.1 hypothetical protein [Achromobacter mucicolens]